MGSNFHTLRRSIDPGDLRFFLWVVRVVEICMYGFVIRGWVRILPGCSGTSALAQGATFAARCLHEPYPISNHSVGLLSGFDVSTPCGAVSTQEICIFVPGLLYLQRYGRISDKNSSFPGVAGPRRWPKRQLSPRATSTSSIQSAITQWGYPVRLGFPHPAGRYRPGRYVYLSPACSICRDMEGLLTRTYPPRVWRDLGVGPRGNVRRALPP